MAKKFFIKSEKGFKKDDNITVAGEEFNHIANVLRKKQNDEICVIDGLGFDYICKIEKINKRDLELKVIKIEENCNCETDASVTVFMALVKGDKFDLIVQKLTELGVKKIVPFESEFCQVKKNTTRLDRLEKISIEALKQCGRSKIVEINKVLSFDEMIENLKYYDKVFFAYENSLQNLKKEDVFNKDGELLKNIAIIVGSEGGFSKQENDKIIQKHNVKQISMGSRILRAETAVISLTSVIMFLLDEWERK